LEEKIVVQEEEEEESRYLKAREVKGFRSQRREGRERGFGRERYSVFVPSGLVVSNRSE